jgi:ubiquinone/menaquinone biosynthesis C-methylase UbiE
MDFTKYQKQWNKLGAIDPMWAVIADPAKKGGGWDEASFFATGTKEIDQMLKELAALADISHLKRALDFGCGVGRVSRALAGHFAFVMGVDISASMIAKARDFNRAIGNIEFILNAQPDLGILDDGSVDFIYSNITLQHVPYQLQRAYLQEFCRVLRPGGLVVFQIPSHLDLKTWRGIIHAVCGTPILNIARRMVYGKHRVMEMHTFARTEVEAILRDHGTTLLKVQPDKSAGPGFISYRYFAARR